MFMRCPHCGFLVALITARDGVDARCPQCQGVLRMDAVGASPADASHADGALVETSPSDSPAEALPSEEVGTDTDTDADAADGEPVDLVFAMAVPDHYTHQHLMVLSELAERFSDEGFRQALRVAPDAEAMRTLLLAKPRDSKAAA